MGEDLINFQTTVSGKRTVIIRSQGPVKTVPLNDERVVADEGYVIARTSGIKYMARRSATTVIGSYLSGEGHLLRNYEGTGTFLASAYP